LAGAQGTPTGAGVGWQVPLPSQTPGRQWLGPGQAVPGAGVSAWHWPWMQLCTKQEPGVQWQLLTQLCMTQLSVRLGQSREWTHPGTHWRVAVSHQVSVGQSPSLRQPGWQWLLLRSQ
jgi:hypothetical protein